MPAQTIDQVITHLDTIITRARTHNRRLGYFPALYRNVTIAVRQGLDDGTFTNPALLERLDVVFANRYLEAYERNEQGMLPTASWALAFGAAERWWLIVLQHLLLGMNAHINFDLGVAAATVAPGADLERLRPDFFKINEILASLVDDVTERLGRVWPLLVLLDKIAGKTDNAIINFSMERARDHAWGMAERLAAGAPDERDALIRQFDRDTAAFGKVVLKPGPLIGLVTKVIRLGERGSVSSIIGTLTDPPPLRKRGS